MLTRKIPSPAPGIASVPSARVEVINFVRKTCCCALGKHIMAISCQFATPPLPPHTDLLLPTNCTVCVCVCVGHAALASAAAPSLASFFAHFSQFVAPGFGLAFDLTRLGSLQPALLCPCPALPCSGQGQCVALRICLCLCLCPGALSLPCPGSWWALRDRCARLLQLPVIFIGLFAAHKLLKGLRGRRREGGCVVPRFVVHPFLLVIALWSPFISCCLSSPLLVAKNYGCQWPMSWPPSLPSPPSAAAPPPALPKPIWFVCLPVRSSASLAIALPPRLC